MSARLALDVSSSTSGNIRQYIKNTELGALITGSTSEPFNQPPRPSVAVKTPQIPPNHLATELQLLSIDDDQSVDVENKSFDQSLPYQQDAAAESDVSGDMFAYHKKIKYLPNDEFDPESIGKSFHLSQFLPSNSIPNTFNYKSHPNAKTKPKLRVKRAMIAADLPERALIEEEEEEVEQEEEENEEENEEQDEEEVDDNDDEEVDEDDKVQQQFKQHQLLQQTTDNLPLANKIHIATSPPSRNHQSPQIDKKSHRNSPRPRNIPSFSLLPHENPLNGQKFTNHPSDSNLAVSNNDIRTSTVKEHITPTWMPDVLNEKWLPPNSFKLDGLGDDFSTSVRINRSTKDIDLNLHNSADTMIHNSQVDANETPEWERVNKAYKERQNVQPWQNIFYSGTESIDTTSKLHSKGTSGGQINQNHSNNRTVSSTSSPIPSLNDPKNLEPPRNGISPHILQNQADKISLNNFSSNRNPESPLKLFHDKYNTFTKDRLNDILQKVQNDSPALNKKRSGSGKKVDSINLSKEFELPKLPDPKMRIKNFTKNGEYTEEQFLRNADNIFKNVQEKFKNRKTSIRDVTNLHYSLVQNSNMVSFGKEKQRTTNSTTTSTPKNERIENISDLVNTISDDYSSYTSGIDDDDEEEEEEANDSKRFRLSENAAGSTNNEYTSYGTSDLESREVELPLSPSNLHKLQRQLSDVSDQYTYESADEGEKHLSEPEKERRYDSENNHFNRTGNYLYESDDHHQSPINIKPQENDKRVNELTDRLQHLELLVKSNAKFDKLQQENDLLKEELLKLKNDPNQRHQKESPQRELTIDSYDFSSMAPEDATHLLEFIKWKRPSQLLLGNSPNNMKPGKSRRNNEKLTSNGITSNSKDIYRGSVGPDVNIPLEYENMRFDSENKKWIRNDKGGGELQGEAGGSLDSIEDLVSQGSLDASIQEKAPTSPNGTLNSAMRGKRSNTNTKSKQEVSFHLPYESGATDVSMESSSKRFLGNITNISQLQNSTFSQTQRRLVNILTEILANDTDWNEIYDLDISNRGIESISELKEFLPRLKSIDISQNSIKFLNGISPQILQLNASKNHLQTISSFESLRDLQQLDLSFNKLTSISSLSRNIHITTLKISNNELSNLNGLENFSNIIDLDVSHNNLSGEFNFSNFCFKNLQTVDVSENNLNTITGLENAPSLRVLNANNNKLIAISSQKHPRLKKVSLKSNHLEELDVSVFPNLRVLRIDGNRLINLRGLQNLKWIEEISCKSQFSGNGSIRAIVENCADLKKLDLSGNSYFINEFNMLMTKPFLNLNQLTLSATGMTKLPEKFAQMFPNLRELNLNFNRIANIDGLAGIENLRKVYLLSNKIEKIGLVVTGLKDSRKSLKILDLRLNSLNETLYPFVFNEQELEYSQHIKNTANIELSPIPLETLEDIENFAILYEALRKNLEDWEERDANYLKKLTDERHVRSARLRVQYETLLVNLFQQLKYLDGSEITIERRNILRDKLKR